MKRIIFIILTITVVFTGCQSKSSASRKPVTNIQISPSNQLISNENEFTILIKSRNTKSKIADIELYIDNKFVKKSNKEIFSIVLNTKNYLPGKHKIKTIAKNEDGKTGTNSINFSIFSNIEPKSMTYKVVATLAHNKKNYTEGLEFYKEKLFEGTGNYGESFIYKYNPHNEKIDRSIKIDAKYFGEGITILNDKIYQLTYKAQKGFVYDAESFEKITEFNFPSKEGWGLTNDGHSLIMSNGTSKIIYLNSSSFKVEKTIEVTTPKGFINNINELEYVDGIIYANIWTTQTIVKFDAQTGKVLAFINMEGLLSQFYTGRVDVLNGIAYNNENNSFYVTGKWWPNIFQVKFE